MYSTQHARYRFSLLGGRVCFVISIRLSDKKLTCISLYGADEASFEKFQTVLRTDLKDKYGLKNEDPPDHDEIHQEMGAEMNLDPAVTMNGNSHYHWVCELDDGRWPTIFFLDMVQNKWISTMQGLAIVQGIQAVQA